MDVGETKAGLHDSTAVSVDRQLRAKMTQFFGERILVADHLISVNIGQYNLDYVITDLIVGEVDELLVVKEQQSIIEGT